MKKKIKKSAEGERILVTGREKLYIRNIFHHLRPWLYKAKKNAAASKKNTLGYIKKTATRNNYN